MLKTPAASPSVEIKGDTEKLELAAQPTPRECAMMTIHLIEVKDSEIKKIEKKVTRARLSENSLRRLWCRSHLTPSFLVEVQEWLLRAGWVLFFAGSGYAIIKSDHVDSWVRISTKRITDDLKKASRGKFKDKFAELERVLIQGKSAEDDE